MKLFCLILSFITFFGFGEIHQDSIAKTKISVEVSCLDQYIDKLDKLLTKEEILSVFSSIPEGTEYEYSRSGPMEYHQCQFKWDSERFYMMKVGDQEYKVDKPNKLGVGRLRAYKERIKDPLLYFKNAHRTPLAEDLEELRKMTDKKMKEEGVTDAEQQVGKDLSSSLAGQISFTAVEGLGDAAAWDHTNSSLSVLVGRTEFEIYVEIGEDLKENQRIAKKLAEIVLAKC